MGEASDKVWIPDGTAVWKTAEVNISVKFYLSVETISYQLKVQIYRELFTLRILSLRNQPVEEFSFFVSLSCPSKETLRAYPPIV